MLILNHYKNESDNGKYRLFLKIVRLDFRESGESLSDTQVFSIRLFTHDEFRRV